MLVRYGLDKWMIGKWKIMWIAGLKELFIISQWYKVQPVTSYYQCSSGITVRINTVLCLCL